MIRADLSKGSLGATFEPQVEFPRCCSSFPWLSSVDVTEGNEVKERGLQSASLPLPHIRRKRNEFRAPSPSQFASLNGSRPRPSHPGEGETRATMRRTRATSLPLCPAS